MNLLNRFFLFFVIGLLVALAGLWIAGGKEEKFTAVVEIDASPGQVFPYLVQPDLMKNWIAGLTQVDQPQPPAGTLALAPELLRTIDDGNGKETTFRDTVIRYTPEEMLSIRSTSGGTANTLVYQLERGDQGRTRLTHTLLISYSGLERFLAPIQNKDFQEQVAADVRRLKQLVEANETFQPTSETSAPQAESGDENQEGDPSSGNATSSDSDLEAEYRVPGFGF